MGAAAISSTLAGFGTISAIVSAILIILLQSKIHNIRMIADTSNLANVAQQLNVAGALAWTGVVLGIITVISYIATPYVMWLKIILTLLTLIALAVSLVYLIMAMNGINNMGDPTKSDTRNYVVSALIFLILALILILIGGIGSLFAKRPVEDIFLENYDRGTIEL